MPSISTSGSSSCFNREATLEEAFLEATGCIGGVPGFDGLRTVGLPEPGSLHRTTGPAGPPAGPPPGAVVSDDRRACVTR